jgi:hypothetical protein
MDVNSIVLNILLLGCFARHHGWIALSFNFPSVILGEPRILWTVPQGLFLSYL